MYSLHELVSRDCSTKMVLELEMFVVLVATAVDVAIAVGQWLVSGLHWSSSARQSLAARQKELSE